MKPTEIKNVITEILESRKEEGGIKALNLYIVLRRIWEKM